MLCPWGWCDRYWRQRWKTGDCEAAGSWKRQVWASASLSALYLHLYLLGGSESLIFCSHVSLSGSLPHTTTTVMRSWLQRWRELQRSNRKINGFSKGDTNILISRGVQLVYDTVGGIELGRNSLKCLQFGGRSIKLALTGALYNSRYLMQIIATAFTAYATQECTYFAIFTH